MKKTLIATVLLNVFLPSLTYADEQTAPQPPYNNYPKVASTIVRVTAMKEDRRIEESGASVAQITDKTMEQQTSFSLADAFRYEPGVNVDTSSDGGLSNIRIRGIGENRLLITVDGAPIPTTYKFGDYLNTNQNYFDIDVMKQIEVVKGPLSTLYGSNTLAGGIFMQTKDPSDYIKKDKRVGGELKIGGNTRNKEGAITGTIAAYLTEELSTMARITLRKHFETSNHNGFAFDQKYYNEYRTHPNASESNVKNAFNKWIYAPNSEHKFTLTYEFFNNQSHGMPFALFNKNIFKIYQQHKAYTYNRNRRQQLNLRHDFSNVTPLFDKGHWQIYGQNSKARQENLEYRDNLMRKIPISRTRTSYFDNKQIGMAAEFSKQFKTASITHNITYGLSALQKKISTTREGDTINLKTGQSIETEKYPNKSFPDSKVYEYGLFVQDRIGFFDNKLEIIPGLRYDYYRLTPKTGGSYESANIGVETPKSMRENHLSKRLAILFYPDDKNVLYANYSEGFKAPAFSAVNIGFSNTTMGYMSKSNPNLKPEKSQSYELGWHFNDDKKSFALTGFYNNYKDFIEELHAMGKDEETGYSVFQSVNLGRSHIYGAEAKASIQFAEILEGRGQFRFDASAAYAKGEIKGSKEPIDSIEPLNGTLGLQYIQDDKLYLALKWKMVKSKSEKDISSSLKDSGITKMPGYGTLDLMAEYKPHPDVTISAGLYNILNKKHWEWGNRMMMNTEQSVLRGTKPGINAALSIKINF